MTGVIILVVLVIAFMVIKTITKGDVMRLPIIFAGNPTEAINAKDIPLPKNEPIYKVKGETISMKGYAPYVISGHSLEPMGIKDGAIAYVNELSKEAIDSGNLKDLIGRYIVLNVDNDRSQKEYPLKSLLVTSGKKARKVVGIVATKLQTDNLLPLLQELLSKDEQYANMEGNEKETYINRIIEKYKFASDYYKGDSKLIMSITYKNGRDKAYSFHSPKFLFGIIEYTSK